MGPEELEEVGGVLVYDDVAVGYVDAESVRQKLFAFLCVSPGATIGRASQG
jgi:hypothetical protein